MRIARLLATLLLAAYPAQAQLLSDIVDIAISVDRSTVRAGEQVTVRVNVSIVDGWHIYSSDLQGLGPIPTHFELDDSVLVTGYGAFREPPSERVWDEGFGIEVGWHSGEVSHWSKRTKSASCIASKRLPVFTRIVR